MRILEFLLSHLPSLTVLGALALALTKVGERRKRQRHAQRLVKEIESEEQPLSLHPEVDANLCSGCGACTMACPEGDILQMVGHKAVLVSPTRCVGHGECEVACPMNAIKLVFGTKVRGVDIPRLSTDYETNIPGLYIAGELGGMGLIRNATKQGVMAIKHALANLPTAAAQFDVVIVGAGPAGFTAGLAAVAAGKSYFLMEQNTFGGTIANFPRQKLVMTHPLELPLVGRKAFAQNTVSKEDILGFWNSVRQKTGLKVTEGTTFKSVTKDGDIFKVETSIGVLTARKVILAMGVRGSPRKLGVPGEDLNKVTYNLVDPEQYQGKRIVVVGGGNAAAEAVIMLSERKYANKVYMVVRSPTLDRCNETNDKKVRALAKEGRIALWFNCKVNKVEPDRVTVASGKETKVIKNDFVFVFAGANMPRDFLMSLGIKIDKKFGQGLGA